MSRLTRDENPKRHKSRLCVSREEGGLPIVRHWFFREAFIQSASCGGWSAADNCGAILLVLYSIYHSSRRAIHQMPMTLILQHHSEKLLRLCVHCRMVHRCRYKANVRAQGDLGAHQANEILRENLKMQEAKNNVVFQQHKCLVFQMAVRTSTIHFTEYNSTEEKKKHPHVVTTCT